MYPTAKKWLDYGIIDIHGHIGSFQGFDIGKDTLIANVERYGIKTCLVSNIDCAHLPGVTADLDEGSANELTAKLVKSDPSQFRGLVWVRPQAGHIETAKRFIDMRLQAPSGKRVFVGMKFHPEFDHYAADDKSVDRFLQLCEKSGIPAVFHCGQSGTSSSPALIYAAARRHAKVPVVLYHMGFNSDHSEAIKTVSMACHKGDANLYLETAQCSTESVLEAIKQVGASRVLFGTDATYYGKDHYKSYVEMIDALKDKLSSTDFDLIVKGNALRIFPLR